MKIKRNVATITINKGSWSEPSVSHDNPEWSGFYFMEFVIDWSLYKGCYGKLQVETMHTDGTDQPQGGFLRLAYQYEPHKMIPIEGSEIETRVKTPARWQLLESGWFKLPETEGVACAWIEGKPLPKKKISLALATVVIAEMKQDG